MGAKWTLLLLIIVPLTNYSCVDRLTFYHRGYNPSLNSKLRFDGYYAAKEPHWSSYVPNAFTPKHFYRDGFVAYHANYKYGLPTEEICTMDNIEREQYVNGRFVWGVHKSLGDTLTIEILQPRFQDLFTTMDRITNEFIVKKDTLLLVKWARGNKNEEYLVDTLYFHPYAYKPDSSKNWIRKMKRYR